MDLNIFLEIIKQGGFAAVAVLAFWLAYKKDKQVITIQKEKDEIVAKLYDRLEAKSEKYLEQHNVLARELNDTVSALADALELEVD